MKNIFKFFHFRNRQSAKEAKERLQIVISHERVANTNPEFLLELRKELLQVICKYTKIDMEHINVNLQKVGNCSILELNVTIPELNPELNKDTNIKKKSKLKSNKKMLATECPNEGS